MCLSTFIMLSARTLNGSAAKAASNRSLRLGLAADLHVEHPQADRGVGAVGVGGGGRAGRRARPSGTCGGRPAARPARRRRWPGRGLFARADGLGRRGARPGRPAAGTTAASRARASSSRGFSATAFRGRVQGVGEPLVGDVQVGQQDVRRGVMRVDRQAPARPSAGRRRACSPGGRPGRA